MEDIEWMGDEELFEKIKADIRCLSDAIYDTKNNPKPQFYLGDDILLYLSYLGVDLYDFHASGGEIPWLGTSKIVEILRKCADTIEAAWETKDKR